MIKEYSLLLIVTGRGMWNCVEDQEFKYSCSYLVLAPTTVLVPSLRPQLHTTKTLLGLNDKMKCIVRQTKTKLEQCQLLLLPTKPPRGKRFATSQYQCKTKFKHVQFSMLPTQPPLRKRVTKFLLCHEMEPESTRQYGGCFGNGRGENGHFHRGSSRKRKELSKLLRNLVGFLRRRSFLHRARLQEEKMSHRFWQYHLEFSITMSHKHETVCRLTSQNHGARFPVLSDRIRKSGRSSTSQFQNCSQVINYLLLQKTILHLFSPLCLIIF